MPTPFNFPHEVYVALVTELIPDGVERDAILADLGDVLEQCELHAVPVPVAPVVPAPPARPRPVVEAASLSEKDAQSLRDGKHIPGAVFG